VGDGEVEGELRGSPYDGNHLSCRCGQLAPQPHNVPCTNIVEVLLPWPNLKVTFLAFLLHEPFHMLTVILMSIKTSLAKYLHNRS
jgi:hypothetical protein